MMKIQRSCSIVLLSALAFSGELAFSALTSVQSRFLWVEADGLAVVVMVMLMAVAVVVLAVATVIVDVVQSC